MILPALRVRFVSPLLLGAVALAACTPKSDATASADSGSAATSVASGAAAAASSSAAAMASAKSETIAAKTIANLAVAARHPGYGEAWAVKKKLVLVKCGEALVLSDGDLATGTTIKNDAFGSKATQCVSQIRGVIGDALIVQNDKGNPATLLDVTTGATTPIADVDAATHTMMNVLSGMWVNDKAGVHFVRGKKGDDQRHYVLGKDALYAPAYDGILRGADLKTGELIWEHGLGASVASDPVVWEMTSDEVIAVPIRLMGASASPPVVLLFRRGDDVVPMWTGTIHGKVKGDRSLLGTEPVHAASSQAPIAKDGEYTLQVSTRGPVLVTASCDAAGCEIPSQLVDVSGAKPSYEVNLTVKTFEQGCK